MPTDPNSLLSLPLNQADPEVSAQIQNEILRQHEGLEMIASENFVSRAVLEAAGTVFTNKYAEGYPGKRYYGGCEFADVVENLARDRAKQIFGAEHANVQPHSGSQANAAAYMSILQPGDTILGLDLAHGGHLTHGHKLNFSGKLYRVAGYQVRKDTETIDYDELEQSAVREQPKAIIGGGSAYPRIFDFERMRQIADKVGAYFGNYASHTNWHFAAALIDRQPAIIVQDPDDPDGRPRYFVVLGWAGDKLVTIRDFVFARYALDGAEIVLLA